MMTLLIIAVVDALFAATSLTADILAIQSGRVKTKLINQTC